MDHQGKCFPKHRKLCVFQPVGEKRVMASTTQKSFSLVSKQIIVVALVGKCNINIGYQSIVKGQVYATG